MPFSTGWAARACNRLHLRAITLPALLWRRRDRRHADGGMYDDAALAAIERDMRAPQPSPAFYALIIHSSPRARLF